MKILLLGASGFIGRHIKKTLGKHSDYELITPSHHDADFTTAVSVERWLPLLHDVDVVINSVGIIVESNVEVDAQTKQKIHQSFSNLHSKAPIALFQACYQCSVKRVIQISALGADEHAFTPYQTSKLAADDVLRKLPISSFILRPSLVYGTGGTSLLMFKRIASLPVIALPDGGNQLIQPVHVSDVVATVMYCLQVGLESKETCQTIDVVGPSVITLADFLLAIRVSLQKAFVTNGGCRIKSTAYIIPVPMKYVLLIAQLLHHLIPMLHPDNLRMLQQGNTADVRLVTNILGRPPLAVEEGLSLTGGL